MHELYITVVPLGATTHEEMALGKQMLKFGCRSNDNWDRDLRALSPYEYWLTTRSAAGHVKKAILSLAARLGVRIRVRVIVVGHYEFGESPAA